MEEKLVFVTNRGDFTFSDGYDGKVWTFRVHNPVQIPEFIAEHIFGYGKEDKEPYLARLGWIKTHSELPEGLEKLSKFEITDQAPEKGRSLSPAVEKVPLPSPMKAGGKVHTVK